MEMCIILLMSRPNYSSHMMRAQVLSEGVLNLPRAFLVAGVPCIVASQWLVDDKLTPELMEEFYGCMKQVIPCV
jgi:CHAT domain-containing protein